MNSNTIIFPNLGITLENVPEVISIGPVNISLYGLVISLAMLVAVIWCYRECDCYNVNKEKYLDICIFSIVFGVIGARLYYVIFAWDYYKDDPLSIFKIWEGGLGIYGGIIFGIITVIVMCKIFKMDFWLIADISVFGLLVGQIAGRWGNFFNREAFGDYTDSIFAMMIPLSRVRSKDYLTTNIIDNLSCIDGTYFISVHPTFLYESVWNLLLLVFLVLYRKHKKFDGELFLMYVGLYGIGRFLIESLRTDQLQIANTNIAISQVVAILFVVFSIVMIVVFRIKKKGATKRVKPIIIIDNTKNSAQK